MVLDEHLLSLPFGLPGDRDTRLEAYLRDEDWGSALTVLRGVMNDATTNPKWLLLLAYVRFRDAAEVMVDELGDAAREALRLLDRATEQGAAHEAVAPLRDAVERALDDVSREELRLTGLLEGGESLSDEDLEAAAFLTWRRAPLRAAALFDELAARQAGAAALVARSRGALCLAEAGAEAAPSRLEEVLNADWSRPELRRERSVVEAAETAQLAQLSGAAFDLAWRLAEERGRALGLPFPSVWPNQDRLLARCLALHETARARALAARIEETRLELPAALTEQLRRARSLADAF